MNRVRLMNLLNSFVRVTLAGILLMPAYLFSEENRPSFQSNKAGRALVSFRTEKAAGVLFGDLESLRNRYTLTDPQLERIAKLNRRFKSEHERWLRLLSPKQVELELLLMDENPDLVKVRLLVHAIGRYTSEIRMNQIAHRLAIERVLTSEQRKKGKEKETVTLPEEHREAPGFPLNLFVPERIILPLPGILR
ncbi:hypothetical protein EHQ27_13590 [Leptospira wolffii]|uniref:Periplasmic heavy metal sensor n=1 Tax=Leptospira wolffii TaxID=409998 RepID=A0A2M9ZF44_9LEPT|nr:hypothetical protein [Leptospira wolffii]PJZ67060.1 hypothetical protein CH371_03010 [Leptospira wolffii]TGK62037.1 hypothetical protein EHQ32_04150 [Leptospira wolffii]TGK68638.1 hypothetical protein EHQ27_13590 [Leptospira wolffii]TGK74578.1 hypothetical protein EHQ35_09630 [Leptospira wolffii]TGL31846.1 hypothetical protein EHQ57_03045 [Leptospira wolffii]